MSKKVEPGKTYIGVVVDNIDPDKQGRLKIKVLDVYEDMKDEDLPWASPWKDLSGNQFNVPEKGKVLVVVFEQGDVNKPEFIFSEHYNVNLENKIKELSSSDYTSMKSLLFDHKTQIYVNDSEGLKIDHKYNNINIKANGIDMNLKDNQGLINIGDSTANQQVILGNNFLNWFDEFIDTMLNNTAFLGNAGSPVLTNPPLTKLLLKYKSQKDPMFLSHHVNVVDNDAVSSVRLDKREEIAQSGDTWKSTKEENKVTQTTTETSKPVEGEKPTFNEAVAKQNITATNSTVVTNTLTNGTTTTEPTPTTSGTTSDITTTTSDITTDKLPIKEAKLENVINKQNLSIPTSFTPLDVKEINGKQSKRGRRIEKIIKFLEDKQYKYYEDVYHLNIVAFRKKKKTEKDENTNITNRFDDDLVVFFKNENYNWEYFKYNITTVPGYTPGESELPKDSVILTQAQYIDKLRMIKVLSEDGELYKTLIFDECVVHVNDDVNRYNFESPIEIGDIMMIDRSSTTGSSEFVFNYSQGNQVFKNINQYNQFIKLCQNQIDIGEKNFFTYTLVDNIDFDKKAAFIDKLEEKKKKFEEFEEKKRKQAQEFIDSKKDKFNEEKNILKTKAEGRQLITFLKIEGYFKDENNIGEIDILKEKVNLGSILKRITFNNGKNEIESSTYEGLKMSYLSEIPSDVKLDNIQLLVKPIKTGFIGSVIEFLPNLKNNDKNE
jgi:hypothetical protein